MDGLFIDSETLYRSLFFELLAAEGITADDAHFLKLIGLGWDEAVATLQSDFPDLAVPEFITRWKAECDPRAGHVPDLKPGADVLMDVIEQRGLPVALATGSQRAVAYGYLDHHGMKGRFDLIIAREDCQYGKPDPDPFLRAAKAIGCKPENCLALEDSCNGVRAAHAGKIPVIFVPDLIAPNDEIRSLALGVAEDLAVVADWLRRLV